MRYTLPLVALGSAAILCACSSVDEAPKGPTQDPDPCADVDEVPAAPATWCEQVAPGPAGVRAVAVDLSAAHAGVRFFAPIAAFVDADRGLAAALQGEGATAAPDFGEYALALPEIVCAIDAAPAGELGAASVTSVTDDDGVVVVRPGTGGVALPAGARVVVVDLRDLPAVEGLREALEAAVAPALAAPVARPSRWVRKHVGLTDEVFSPMNVYENLPFENPQDPIPAGGAVDLPIVVATGGRLAPEAAEIAAALRAAGRAWIAGVDVRVEVAETRWQGVGGSGLAYRIRDLSDAAGRLPEVIPADRRTAAPACLAAELAAGGAPPAIERPAAARPVIEAVDGFDQAQPIETSTGTARAALIVAHGAARTFFPYFETVGDTIDERLLETLGDVGESAPDRATLRNLLRRFGAALVDGHNFVFDGDASVAGWFPVYIEDIDGEPVVRRSNAVGVAAGDTITSIGGVPAAQWYAEELARTSAATDGYRFNIATRETLRLDGPIEFGIRDPDGNTKTIVFTPQPVGDYYALGFAPSLRPAGWLDDLGAPTLYYINLSDSVLSDITDFRAALQDAQTAAGLVLDMRGYPGINHYEAAMRLVQETFSSPVFRVPILAGPDVRETDESSYSLEPTGNPSYAGPIVLLVGHGTVSAAENFSTMLVDAGRVKVIGRRSAGTNGNITGVHVPGGFAFTFTGMEVLHADAAKSRFHGVGIAPDADVPLSAADFRDGVDPEIDAAIAWLSSP